MIETEALKILKRDLEIQKENKALPDGIEASEIAINALEKHIAKKLKHGVCPNCSTNNDKIIKHLGNPQAHKSVYCWNCGQKLDWSEV